MTPQENVENFIPLAEDAALNLIVLNAIHALRARLILAHALPDQAQRLRPAHEGRFAKTPIVTAAALILEARCLMRSWHAVRR